MTAPRRRRTSPQPQLPGAGWGPPAPPPLERRAQAGLIAWATNRAAIDERAYALAHLYAIPNGAWYGEDRQLAARIGKAMEQQGLKDGVPDLCLPVPAPRPASDPAPPNTPADYYCGLYLEMKREWGSDYHDEDQERWIAWLLDHGYRVRMCRGEAEARAFLCEYLDIPEDLTGV